MNTNQTIDARTPGPWIAHPGYKDSVHIGPVVQTAIGLPVAFVSYDGAPCGDSAEAQANAAFIVTACNAHDELVAALKRAQYHLEGQEWLDAAAVIRAALARAGIGITAADLLRRMQCQRAPCRSQSLSRQIPANNERG